ncbi:mannose-6-phosphate isomerase, class I [Anaerocolumna cellulosilytica]|uniref:mannose-6-phosphate isomerase n=1 Tax=Anaerocolumna cellulosilytica TaxID=433286 RepID=A0A6S6QVE3_9FIRM|nr:mannose-6-phosphate isomerase, class I [Anaerocolumna cellulosilytica]MBB5194204.1 mannose-6-phosphate isomerase/beta-glucosidase [Anaerocolumna cellulosilytica]BCJ94584.1 mannose-6-phosphate isomerase, class I [Anaerocolumna cellulosilytica]
MKEVIFLEPVFKEMIWGGNRLKTDFGYAIPSDHTGECWAVSAHANGDCTVKNGTYKGEKLSRLWQNHKELFGNAKGDTFPLLIKIIDAKADLSIQVHPDDAYAKVHENGSLGKTECWYILNCDTDGKIIVGHNAKNKEELQQMIGEHKWDELIRVLPITKGDFFQIEPGTVHAIKAGTVILETQQNSDITYRLYDYDRLSDGKPRELHIDKSIDVIPCPHKSQTTDRKSIHLSQAIIEELVSCEFYTVNKVTVNGQETLQQTEPFTILSVIEGSGEVDGTSINKGDHFILPFGYGAFQLKGSLQLITSHI